MQSWNGCRSCSFHYCILHLMEKSSFGYFSIYLNSKTWVSTLSGKVLAKVWGLLIYFSPMPIMSLFEWLGSLTNILFFTFVTGYLKWKYVVVHKYMAVEEIQLTPTRTHLTTITVELGFLGKFVFLSLKTCTLYHENLFKFSVKS